MKVGDRIFVDSATIEDCVAFSLREEVFIEDGEHLGIIVSEDEECFTINFPLLGSTWGFHKNYLEGVRIKQDPPSWIEGQPRGIGRFVLWDRQNKAPVLLKGTGGKWLEEYTHYIPIPEDPLEIKAEGFLQRSRFAKTEKEKKLLAQWYLQPATIVNKKRYFVGEKFTDEPTKTLESFIAEHPYLYLTKLALSELGYE